MSKFYDTLPGHTLSFLCSYAELQIFRRALLQCPGMENGNSYIIRTAWRHAWWYYTTNMERCYFSIFRQPAVLC